MKPENYYQNLFPTHFETFWASLQKNGSTSRFRGSLLAQGISTGLPQSNKHFSCYDFAKVNSYPDHLLDVPLEHHLDLLFCTFIRVLTDQFFFTHFASTYHQFRKAVPCPKMDATSGPAGYANNASPYHLFDGEIMGSRGWTKEDVAIIAPGYMDLCVTLLQNLSEERDFPAFQEIATTMLHDPDCFLGPCGPFLTTALRTRLESFSIHDY